MRSGESFRNERVQGAHALPGSREISRRAFLKTAAGGLAGATLLGAAGCGGGGSQVTELRWSMWSGTPAETKVGFSTPLWRSSGSTARPG